MDLRFSEQEEAFRAEFAGWLSKNLPPEWTQRQIRRLPIEEQERIGREWQLKLGESGWLCVAWPREIGGRGASLVEQVIYSEELAKAGAPPVPGGSGHSFIGPTILEVGTDEQKERFLAPTISGEFSWYQGFSEPNAGSDLAGLQTRARLDGDEWIVNGQKIWGGGADIAQWGAVLVRTDPEAPKHRGISFMLVDMKSPGITVRRIRQINGGESFNEVFFDDVHVPKENILGPVNEGWRVANRLLTYERGVITLSIVIGLRRLWEELRDYAKAHTRNGVPLAEVPHIREALASSYCNVRLMQLANLRYLTWYLRGQLPGIETSYMKFYWSESAQSLGDLAVALGGPDGLSLPEAPGLETVDDPLGGGDWMSEWLYSRVSTVYGGTLDIQRNIVAERGLGLPRGT